MPKVKIYYYEDRSIRVAEFKCPGCGYRHVYYLENKDGKVWQWNQDLNNPSFTPSLLNLTGSFAEPTFKDPPELPPTRCHLFVTNGKIIYCGDCTHDLNGKTIDLPEIQ